MSTHHFRTTFLSTQWPWRPLSLLIQCSAASPSQTAASHSLNRKRTLLSSSSAKNTLLVCLFNARSVSTPRRRSNISTFIQDNNIDIMLLTETWLRPAGDEAKIADLAPPGYSVLSFSRSAGGSGAKGRGIAFVIRDSLKPHIAATSSFPVQHPCFETAQLTLTYNKRLTNLFCIYHHHPAKRTNLLTSLNTLTVCLAKHSLWVTLTFILKM